MLCVNVNPKEVRLCEPPLAGHVIANIHKLSHDQQTVHDGFATYMPQGRADKDKLFNKMVFNFEGI